MINSLSLSFINKINKSNTNSVSFAGRKQPSCDIVEIKGTETKAKVYTTNLDYKTYEQIKTICSHPVFKDTPVRIMPDTHAGKNTVVGFTAPINAQGTVIPSIISGDIGCGMLCVQLDTRGQEIDFDALDNVIKKYVSTTHTENPSSLTKHAPKITKEVTDLCKRKYKVSPDKVMSTLGTVGGGNHFIELDRNEKGETFLVIHTGSRHFGKEVCNHHQKVAMEQNPYKIKDLSFLSGDEAKEYLSDMKIATKYSEINRRIIADEIMKRMGWREKSSFESIHNYIGKDGIIRKGAISAQNGERIIIYFLLKLFSS